MNAKGGPPEARRAKEGAAADFAGEMKDTTTVRRGGFMVKQSGERVGYQTMFKRMK